MSTPRWIWSNPTALVVGNEAHGLAESLAAHLDGTLRIPMAGSAELPERGDGGLGVVFRGGPAAPGRGPGGPVRAALAPGGSRPRSQVAAEGGAEPEPRREAVWQLVGPGPAERAGTPRGGGSKPQKERPVSV